MNNNNKVELIGYYGSDETHACSAWTSTSRDLTEEKRARIPQLLAKLAADGHHTPFEKSSLHFLVTCDQASHIHFLKHRIGVSINAESARYKEFTEDKFYIPEDWPEKDKIILRGHLDYSFHQYHTTIKKLIDSGLSKARAKESARFFLPYSSQIQLDIMFNFRSFVHFLKLRNKPEAQKEIRDIAAEMLRQVSEIPDYPFANTITAFKL